MELKKRNIKLALSVVGACFGAGLTVAAGAAVGLLENLLALRQADGRLLRRSGAHGAQPIALGHLVERRRQALRMVCALALGAVAQQQPIPLDGEVLAARVAVEVVAILLGLYLDLDILLIARRLHGARV